MNLQPIEEATEKAGSNIAKQGVQEENTICAPATPS